MIPQRRECQASFIDCCGVEFCMIENVLWGKRDFYLRILLIVAGLRNLHNVTSVCIN